MKVGMGSYGLGDVACGDNPCGLMDFVSPSPACATYVGCVAQETASQSASGILTNGIPIQTVAYAGGALAQEAAAYAAQVAAQAAAAAVGGATNTTPGTLGNTALTIGVVAAIALVGFMVLTKT